jgi:hypothetical protein
LPSWPFYFFKAFRQPLLSVAPDRESSASRQRAIADDEVAPAAPLASARRLCRGARHRNAVMRNAAKSFRARLY